VADEAGVLVADLARTQDVKAIGERLKNAPRRAPFGDLPGARAWFDRWMQATALPLWWALGADHEHGGFREVLDFSGADAPRRARVQPRQAYAFATAGALGWNGPWRAAVESALGFMETRQRGADGLLRSVVGRDGDPIDGAAKLYDHAFALLAYASVGREAEALDLLERLQPMRHARGWREAGDRPFQSNPLMHLFEAVMAWERAGGGAVWGKLADELAELAMERLVDAEHGCLREYFDEAWAPAAGDAGRIIEPGHQFEWAWLLAGWSRMRGRADAMETARRLYACGLKGIDRSRGVAVCSLWADFTPRDLNARLWPQTEYLKAALVLGEESEALAAARAVAAFLDDPVPGAWRDMMDETGRFDRAPAPASTLYHLVAAWKQLREA
jgi:mannose/cellobiose epimerase-like protein (N-acyl-D-glucosamine 2-epimerase family)